MKPRAGAPAVSLVLALTLAGCSGSPAPGSPEAAPDAGRSGDSWINDGAQLLADFDLEGLDAPAIIEQLDSTPVSERPAGLMASVQPEALVLSDEQGRETSLPIDGDRFYVSIAPYVEQSHDCYFHSLTTCLGELPGAEFELTVTDEETGEILVDGPMRSYDNGFVGLWLPRGIDAEIAMEREGRSARASVSTRGTDDPTCITTLRLT